VPGGMAYDPGTLMVTFEPIWEKLKPGTTYTCTITTGARAELGAPLTSEFVWRFTTVPDKRS
ncbi:MAG: Ig-like domain-containing protein, partial [Candidatus Aminicenantes bacterium]|nr:Ig-like domain-containing protein [Candidatus Aminicenantes bacterium]